MLHQHVDVLLARRGRCPDAVLVHEPLGHLGCVGQKDATPVGECKKEVTVTEDARVSANMSASVAGKPALISPCAL